MEKLRAAMVLFDRFELLDACGPLEMFGQLQSKVDMTTTAMATGPIRSAQGPALLADTALSELDILLIPGGIGRLRAENDPAILAEIKRLAEAAAHVGTICTGASILAHTGLLDGLSATTNKRAFESVRDNVPKVNWVPQARWVEDGKFFTSAGVSAGMDMALALIAKLFGQNCAVEVARIAEYQWHSSPEWDPFAEAADLV